MVFKRLRFASHDTPSKPLPKNRILKSILKIKTPLKGTVLDNVPTEVATMSNSKYQGRLDLPAIYRESIKKVQKSLKAKWSKYPACDAKKRGLSLISVGEKELAAALLRAGRPALDDYLDDLKWIDQELNNKGLDKRMTPAAVQVVRLRLLRRKCRGIRKRFRRRIRRV